MLFFALYKERLKYKPLGLAHVQLSKVSSENESELELVQHKFLKDVNFGLPKNLTQLHISWPLCLTFVKIFIRSERGISLAYNHVFIRIFMSIDQLF